MNYVHIFLKMGKFMSRYLETVESQTWIWAAQNEEKPKMRGQRNSNDRDGKFWILREKNDINEKIVMNFQRNSVTKDIK